MLVLGIIDSKPSTAALLDDGRVLAAVAEERLSRQKMATGMPNRAIAEVLRIAGASADDVDQVAVAQRVGVFQPEAVPWQGWFESDLGPRTSWLHALGSGLAPIVGRLPLAPRCHHALKRLVFRDRVTRIPRWLVERHGIRAPVRFFDHHRCHAVGAWLASGFPRALVVTLDGGGDGLSGSVSLAERGELRRLASVDSYHSLGNFYSYVTALCGFKAERHEGKVTGLAALGEPRHADALRQLVEYRDPGAIRYRVPMYHRSALQAISRRLPRGFDRADLAASVQLVLEEVACAFIAHWLQRTGASQVAVAGGVFSNVKLNQRIHELAGVEGFFVDPSMDDGGLAVGSALALELERHDRSADELLHPLPHVYLGPAFGDHEIERATRGDDLEVARAPAIHERIAELLAAGNVVARFCGRMELGPRALGHRSILYRPDDRSVNDWLNERLARTEFMPFAPATLSEHAQRCYRGLGGAESTARFMTVTFDCTPEMKERSPGVVHVDGTARPQVVDPDTAPDLHAILERYHSRTGNPTLVNTSFNLHEEPIVCTPADALRAFQQGRLDYLAIHDLVIRRRGASRHPASGRDRGRMASADVVR
jgi:carbamoyltransferase